METPRPPWLLLVHQIPGKPDYLRVKIGRRLQQIGSVAVKNSVYVLPNRERCREDFEWVRREVVTSGGEAMVFEAEPAPGGDPDALINLFRSARKRDYNDIAEAARALFETPQAAAGGERSTEAAVSLRRLERRLATVRGIDFFTADGARAAAGALVTARERLTAAKESRAPREERPSTGRGRTWTTRAGVEEDRIASAWLIQRFLDPAATFRFAADGEAPREGELRFDMFEGDYTHEGDRCTFEVLLDRFEVDDAGLRAIAEMVHDVDLGDEKFSRPETEGFARFIQGLVNTERSDEERLARGGILLDALYAALRAE